MRFIFGVITGFILSTVFVFADIISAPPPIKDPAIYHYLRELYDNFHKLEIVTTDPNKSRSGQKGEELQVVTGGKYYHCENVDGVQAWYCTVLTAIQ